MILRVNYILLLVMFIETIILILITISFLTLLERKLLSYMQLRKGPNKTGVMGLLQPFSDGIKLFSKEFMTSLMVNKVMFYLSPLLSMILMFSCWTSLPYMVNYMNHEMHGLLIICIISLGVYLLMISGWSTSSPVAMAGSLRSIAQTISYEVSMIFIIYSVMLMAESFNLLELYQSQYYTWFIFSLPMVGYMLFVSMLAELNRTPFDLSEGESELVSGFNTEYGASPFSLLFLGEYGMILFMSFLFSLFFLGGKFFSFYFYLMFLMMVILIIWVRGSFPRMRYDHVMSLVWKNFLLFILGFLMFLCLVKSIFTMLLM